MNKHVFGLVAVPIITAGFSSALISPVFADDEIGIGGAGVVPATCASLQQEINDAPDFIYTPIALEEDCQADIVIPASKYIRLWASTPNGTTTTEFTLINNEGDTITVEEGAKILLGEGTFKNTSTGKAVIKNSGLVAVGGSKIVSENGSYTFINNGEINIEDAEITGFKVDNSESSILRIAHGTIDDEEAAEPYVTGCINCEIGSDGTGGMFSLPEIMPVGYSETFEFLNPEYWATHGMVVESSDSSVLEITGSTLSGYKVTAKKAGVADVTVTGWFSAGGRLALVYDINSNIPNFLSNRTILGYLAGVRGSYTSTLRQAVENSESISVNLNIDELEKEDIEAEDLDKINEALGNGKIISYGDISLTIDSEESGLLDQIYLLGEGGCGQSDESSEPVCIFEEDPIDVKWGGLELGEPAEGYVRNYYAIRVHDGEVKKIPASIDADGNIVFPSGRFSLYAIAYEDEEIVEDEKTASVNSPETGAYTQNSGNMVLSIAGSIATGIIVALAMLPKIRKHIK